MSHFEKRIGTIRPGGSTHPRSIGLGARLTCAFVGALALVCLLAAGASASYYVHPFVKEFGPDGTAATKFALNTTVVVDKTAHDVYVADPFASRVYRFDSTGAPKPFTEGETPGKHWLRPPIPVGAAQIGVGLPRLIPGVAIAPPGAAGGTAGDIYLPWNAEKEGKVLWGVEIYSPTGLHLGTLDGSGNPHHFPTSGHSAHPCGVGVDAAGSVYVSYCDAGFENGESPEPNHVNKYVPTANPVTEANFNSEIFNNASGEGVLPAPSGLYIEATRFDYSLFPGGGGSADVTGKGSKFPLPGGATFNASNYEASDIDVAQEEFYLAYETTATAYFPRGVLQLDEEGHKHSLIPVPDLIGGVGFDEGSGRLYASNNNGQNQSVNKVRIYDPAVPVSPPVTAIDSPSSVTYQSAHFTGTVNPGGSGEGYETLYRFECTPSCPGLYSAGVRPPLNLNRTLPADGVVHQVSDDASGLEPETEYEVKLVATNAFGLQEVVDATSFKTPAVPTLTAPVVTIAQPTEVTAESTHLSGTVDPMGSGEGQGTTYRFEYTGDGLKWIPLETQGPIEGSGPQPVSAELEGLQPNTTYSVRLRAENGGGTDVSDEPNPSFTTTAPPPQVEISPATNVLTGAAQLNGRVNPSNSQTTYYFQWGTADCATSACASIPASQDAQAGTGGTFVSVHAQLEGLSPGTTYQYRLIAENATGQVSTGDATFTTGTPPGPCENKRVGLSTALPDCRAYEMVSPLDKGGRDISSETFKTRAAADGNAVSFVAQSAFADAEGYPYSGAEYLSARGPEGWSTHAITPALSAPGMVSITEGSMYTGFASDDLDRAVYRRMAPNPGTNANVEGVDNLFLATGMRSGAPQLTLLSDSVNQLGEQLPNHGATDTDPVAFVDSSEDFTHVAFEDSYNLTSNTSGTGTKLYEWDNGALRLAGVLPDTACGSPPCVAPESVGGAGARTTGYSEDGTNTQIAHAVSDDGSKVFFTAGSLERVEGDSGLEGSIYVREDGVRTTQIDASERSAPDPNGPGRSEFEWAAAEGEEVLFFSREELVDADTDGKGLSLYRWMGTAPQGARLTLISTPGLVLQHVIGGSADGSLVYLLAGHAGEDREVFVLHGTQMRKVATLGGRSSLQEGNREEAVGELGVGSVYDQARIVPDGRDLLFHSRENLTGYDSSNPGCNSGRCLELYLYSYDADEVVCVSCDPSGAPPTGGSPIFNEPMALTSVFGGSTSYINTPISADGRYVFFTSPDDLVPQDSNGRYDAYVYDVDKRELRLLSSGQCNCDSIFLTASPSGHDAFFTTRQQLVRADSDNVTDLYDARVGGGIPAQNALPPAECQGDACQAPPTQPNDVTPASSSFNGAGNQVSKAARKRHNRHKHRHRKRTHHRHSKALGASSKRRTAK